MQNRYQDYLGRNRNLSDRLRDEDLYHHESAVERLRRFPVHRFEPGGDLHEPALWQEYEEWVDYLGCTDRMSFQTFWRFEDWDKRCRMHARRARWSGEKFDPGARRSQESTFKSFFAGTEAVREHYRTLGLSPIATNEEIKAAFRRLATQHHPDRDGGNTAEMQRLNVAYETLRRLRRF
jgi:hypothetical protein